MFSNLETDCKFPEHSASSCSKWESNGMIPNKKVVLVRQPSVTNDCYCHSFFCHSLPQTQLVRGTFCVRKACSQFWCVSVWHLKHVVQNPTNHFNCLFFVEVDFIWLVSLRKWCFLCEELQGIILKHFPENQVICFLPTLGTHLLPARHLAFIF